MICASIPPFGQDRVGSLFLLRFTVKSLHTVSCSVIGFFALGNQWYFLACRSRRF